MPGRRPPLFPWSGEEMVLESPLDTSVLTPREQLHHLGSRGLPANASGTDLHALRQWSLCPPLPLRPRVLFTSGSQCQPTEGSFLSLWAPRGPSIQWTPGACCPEPSFSCPQSIDPGGLGGEGVCMRDHTAWVQMPASCSLNVSAGQLLKCCL